MPTTRTIRYSGNLVPLASLALEPADRQIGGHTVGRHVPADPGGATAVPGVRVAGNLADVMAQVIGAAAAGVSTAAAINADLIAEDTRAAAAISAALLPPVASVTAASRASDSSSTFPSLARAVAGRNLSCNTAPIAAGPRTSAACPGHRLCLTR